MGAYYTLCRFLSIGTCKAFYHSHSYCYRPLSINIQVWGGHFTVGPSSGIQLDSNLAIWSAQWRSVKVLQTFRNRYHLFEIVVGQDRIPIWSSSAPYTEWLMDASHQYLARSYGSTQACVRGYSISIVFVLSWSDRKFRTSELPHCFSCFSGKIPFHQ